MEKFSEFAIVRSLAEHCCKRIVQSAVGDLQNMDAGLLGEETGLRDLWEEVCVQVQSTESPWWRHYEDAIWLTVSSAVETLQPFEREAIWLQTPEGEDWDCEDEAERNPYPVFTRDIIEYLVHDHVLAEAGRWSSPRVEAFIGRANFRD